MMELGKYAAPVLAAWAITLALLAGLALQSWLAARKARADLDRAERDRGRRAVAHDAAPEDRRHG